MSENDEKRAVQAEIDEIVEAEVEAHVASILPLQGLGTPDDGVAPTSGKSTFSIGC